MFVAPPLLNSYVEILTPNVMILEDEAFEKRLACEGGGLMNGISALMKETPESSRGHKANMTTCNPEKALTLTQRCWHPDLGPPTSRTIRNKFLSISHPAYDVF